MNTEDLLNRKTLTSEKLTRDIESLVSSHNMEYIDAIVHYCETNKLEIESIASVIKSNSRMKSRVQFEAETLNFLPKSSRLPI